VKLEAVEVWKRGGESQRKPWKFFDRGSKTDVYYEAQLIAVELAKEKKLSVCLIIKNIQPISVGV
jgi:hypothetical protein